MLAQVLNKISLRENKRRYLNLKGIISRRYAYKGPDVVQIDLTDRCNSGCSACWIHSPFFKKDTDAVLRELDFCVLKNFIDEVKKSGAKELIFSGGGEPFMYPRIWEVLEYAQDKGPCFRINTNFTLLKEEDLKRLAGFKKLRSLTISVWAGEEDLYSRVHNRPAETFSCIRENLKILNAIKRKHLEVKLYSVVSNINYSNLESLVDLAAETGCPAVELGVIDIIPGITEQLLLNQGQLDILKNYFLKLERYAKNKKTKIFNKDLFLRRISSPGAEQGEYDDFACRIPCYAGWLFLRLRANGEINPCLKGHRLPSGNIYKENFFTIWDGPRQQLFRENGVSLPRNQQYFKLIGNSEDGRGCARMCDNLAVNEHTYNLMRYLSAFAHLPAGREDHGCKPVDECGERALRRMSL